MVKNGNVTPLGLGLFLAKFNWRSKIRNFECNFKNHATYTFTLL